jgi:uncharacterized protein YaiL (DUF2058 family)
MAKLSLQQQLLQAGLVSAATAKTVKTEKRKQQKQQQHQSVEAVDAAKLQAQQTKAEQVAKDRLLNQQKQQEAEQKARAAEIKQWIAEHQYPQDPDGLAYHFTDGTTVKTMYVSETMRQQLSRGRLAIVKSDKVYAVVSLDIAEKIRAWQPQQVLCFNKAATETSGDDPYAAYVIPDDLMW